VGVLLDPRASLYGERPDAKAEALTDWMYLQQEEGDPALKFWSSRSSFRPGDARDASRHADSA
jgi:hypothetical protein